MDIATPKGPSWSEGCYNCSHGIVKAPELTRTVPLYLERLVQFDAHEIEFCSCKAGVCYAVSLTNLRQALREEARAHPMMMIHAINNTHPDIGSALLHVTAYRERLKHDDKVLHPG